MVTFVRKKIKSQTLGEKLKKIRQNSYVTLNEISKAKKIRKEYLEKIEAGEYDKLPPEVYIKGFLRGYAEYLRIDVDQVIKQFDKEKKIDQSIKKKTLPKNNKKFNINIPHLTLTPRIISVLIFIILTTSGFIYFYKELNNFSQDPRLVILQPSGSLSIEKNSFEIIGITDEGNQVSINGQPVYVNNKGEFKENLSLQKGLNSIKIEARNKFGNINEEEINISANYEIEVAGEQEKRETTGNNNSESGREKLILEIKAQDIPIWIAVKVDDKGLQSGTMLPNSSQTFEAQERILLTSGKANKTLIKINGEDKGILNKSPGVIRDVIITKEEISFPENQPTENKEDEKEDKKN